MSSLRQILAAHAPLLWIDAASSRVQTGWLEQADRGRWQVSDDEAGVGIFLGLEALGIEVLAAGGFVFCEGPGSVLGVRTAAMALRTWRMLKPRPVFAYSSLALVAHALGRPEVGIIADARRESWHHFQLGATLRRLTVAELGGELAMPEHFRHWSPLPANVVAVPYAVPELLPHVWDIDFLRETDAPDAFLHEEPSYATWMPRVHRAP